jgi:transcriptional regulator with XRE-family HTH domain
MTDLHTEGDRMPTKASNYQRDARARLKRTRRQLRLSQSQMGKLLGGKSRDTISRVELGQLLAPPALLALLDRLQRCHADYQAGLRHIAQVGRKLKWGD